MIICHEIKKRSEVVRKEQEKKRKARQEAIARALKKKEMNLARAELEPTAEKETRKRYRYEITTPKNKKIEVYGTKGIAEITGLNSPISVYHYFRKGNLKAIIKGYKVVKSLIV